MTDMTTPTNRRARPKRGPTVPLAASLVAALVCVGTLAGCSAAGQGSGPTAGGEASRGAVSADPGSREGDVDGAAGGFQDPAPRDRPDAVAGVTAARIEIPSIGVDSTLEQLALDPGTGELTPPEEWLAAGWYRDGTVPGQVGPAVIAGHVDSITAPAVFARLGELTPGDRISVTLSTGEVTTFSVDSSTTAPKDAFPTDLVYGQTPTAQLRLITCDGVFDDGTGHYLDNLIVFASLEA